MRNETLNNVQTHPRLSSASRDLEISVYNDGVTKFGEKPKQLMSSRFPRVKICLKSPFSDISLIPSKSKQMLEREIGATEMIHG